MSYIVFDLEFNQGFDKHLNKTISNEKCPFEIIQIGAIKMDSNFKIIDTFNYYIKPTIYKDIHPYVKKMTKIKPNDLVNGLEFTKMYERFLEFIGGIDSVFCVWGTNDLKELYRNVRFYNLDTETLSRLYINVQDYASAHFKNPPGKSIGLKNAIQLLNLDEDMMYHNALNDAYYTAQVFLRIHPKNITPQVYNYTTASLTNRKSANKTKTNYDKLFSEFERILGRKLTKEDKKIINTAYTMGKKQIFSVPIESLKENSKEKKKH
jgi:inhibitor of KinA sporulation pathway (predicted exonuclease)